MPETQPASGLARTVYSNDYTALSLFFFTSKRRDFIFLFSFGLAGSSLLCTDCL